MEIGRKLAIMATVVTVALAAIGIMALIVVVKLKLSSCDLVALEPRLNLKELANLESADAKVMANFQGYLRYSQTRASAHNIFLPLKLEAVGYWRTQNGVQVVLSADCGRVSFDYMLANGSQGKNSVVSMTITIGRGYEQAAKVCHIYHPNIMARPSKHYSCRRQVSYSCISPEGQLVAILVITALGFEVRDQPEKLRAGEFSTPAEYCNQPKEES